MNYIIDNKFKEHMVNLQQVFLYLIDECNLNCVQCLYKPNNKFHIGEKNYINFDECKMLLEDFYEMGARKLTLMGGEPTLYDVKNNNENLLKLITFAKSTGYEYVRIDTNGQFKSDLLYRDEFKQLDEITFSLDGYSAKMNDPIRGMGSFNKCLNNLVVARKLGYNINITTCLHKGLIEQESGKYNIERMICFAIEHKIPVINFHDLFKMSIPRDTWSGNIGITSKEWYEKLSDILIHIEQYRDYISIRLPYNYISRKEFDRNPSYYGYCSAKLGDRILVHPDGTLRICSLMIGTPYYVAKYYENKIEWERGKNCELACHKLNENTPCTHQMNNKSFSIYVPTCVSFKPKQDEFVWKNKLRWEMKSIDGGINEYELDTFGCDISARRSCRNL